MKQAIPAPPLQTTERLHALKRSGTAGRWFGRPIVRTGLLFVLMMAVATPLIAVVQHWHHHMSVYDEVAYLDYVDKVDHGHFIVGKGEHVDAFTARVAACRGVDPSDRTDALVCAGQVRPVATGLDTADIDPPTYYVLTAGVARIIRATGITKDVLTSARLVGVLWASLALTLLLLFARRLGASWRAASLVALLALFAPLDLAQWTYVTPHALEIPVAIAAAWVAVNWAEGGGRWWHLALVGLAAPLVKATTVLGVAIAILFLLVVAYWSRRNAAASTRRLLSGAVVLVTGLAIGTVAWVVVRDHYALMSGNEFPQFDVSSFHIKFLTTTVASFLRPTAGIGTSQVGAFFAILVFGVPFRLLGSARPIVLRSLTLSMVVAGLFGAWLFVFSNYVLLGQFIEMPVRYGLAVMAVALGLLAVAVEGRMEEIALACAVVALLTIDLVPQFW